MAAGRYRYCLLLILLVLYAYNVADRIALGLVLQNIKQDLRLSDTELGVLTGIAFAFFYALMGIPLARWADRANRVTVIALTAAIGSVFVFLCGVTTNFLQLLLMRIGVAVGEAGGTPPAYSLITDYFTREERPRAVGVYSLGGSLALVMGNFLAGWVNQFYGWRVMFMFLGAPGLIFAALAWFTLKEPRLTRWPQGESGAQHPVARREQPKLREVCTTLFNIATFRHLVAFLSVFSFFSAGLSIWLPAYFIRSFHLSSGVLGTWFAIIFGAAGAIGTYGGGEIAARYAPGNERMQTKAIAFLFMGLTVVYALLCLSESYLVAFALLAVAVIGGYFTNAPIFSAIQSLVPERLRATSIAVVYLFVNLIGLGLGPLAAGALSDLFHPWAGEESLRYALLVLCPGYLWAAWHMWSASKTISHEMDAARAQDHAGASNQKRIAA